METAHLNPWQETFWGERSPGPGGHWALCQQPVTALLCHPPKPFFYEALYSQSTRALSAPIPEKSPWIWPSIGCTIMALRGVCLDTLPKREGIHLTGWPNAGIWLWTP
jgi:hypothetical protein